MSFHSLSSDVMIVYELIIRLNCNKCRIGFIWCTDGRFINPSMFKKSNRTAFGYVWSDDTAVRLKISTSELNWNDAESYCTDYINNGKSGYFPNRYELADLYNSIMSGKMKEDLIEAGIYEKCNYREASSIGWGWIWSSSEYGSNYAYYMGYYEEVFYNTKSTRLYALPFFNFKFKDYVV